MTSLENEKIRFICCRLKVYKMRSKINFWITASTNGESKQLCHKPNNFCIFGSGSGVLECDWRSKFLKKKRWFVFFVIVTRLFCNAVCTVSTKQHYSRFLALKRIIQNVTVGSALFTAVKTRRFLGRKVNTIAFPHLEQCTCPLVSCTLFSTPNSSSRKMVVQKLFSWRRQQAPSCQRISLEAYCHSLDKIFYSQSLVQNRETTQDRRWRLGKSVCFTVDWKCIKSIFTWFLVNCIKQWEVDTIMP